MWGLWRRGAPVMLGVVAPVRRELVADRPAMRTRARFDSIGFRLAWQQEFAAAAESCQHTWRSLDTG